MFTPSNMDLSNCQVTYTGANNITVSASLGEIATSVVGVPSAVALATQCRDLVVNKFTGALYTTMLNTAGGPFGLQADGTFFYEAPVGSTSRTTSQTHLYYGGFASGVVVEHYRTTSSLTENVAWVYAGGDANTVHSGNASFYGTALVSGDAATTTLGTTSNPWSGVVSQTAVQVVSDERTKTVVGTLGDTAFAESAKLLAAWEEIQSVVYLTKDTGKREHMGVLAQAVYKAFADAGLDAAKYGVWCEEPLTTSVYDPAAGTHTNKPVLDDSGVQIKRQSIRYDELLVLGVFCEKLNRTALEARVAALEKAAKPAATA